MEGSMRRSTVASPAALRDLRGSPVAGDRAAAVVGSVAEALSYVETGSEEWREVLDACTARDSSTAAIVARFPRIQHVARPERYQRYLRCRNELQAAWQRVDAAGAGASAEAIAYLPTTPTQLRALIEEGAAGGGGAVLYTTFGGAQLVGDALAGDDAAEAMVLIVVAYGGPPGEPDARGATFMAQDAVSPMRSVLCSSVVTADGVQLKVFDHCQWSPLYIVSMACALPEAPADGSVGRSL
jgi:hypothetical protein